MGKRGLGVGVLVVLGVTLWWGIGGVWLIGLGAWCCVVGDWGLWVGVLVMLGIRRFFCAWGSAGDRAANRETSECGRGKNTARSESWRLLGRRNS